MNRLRAARPALLLALAAAGYGVAAWAVQPGFFDGLQSAVPYHWVSPPPGVRNGGTPAPGHLVIKVAASGQSEPGTAFTGDAQPQAEFAFLPGAFQNPGGGQNISIDIAPVSSYPPLGALKCVTNVYEIRSSSPMTRESLVTLKYSDQVPAPTDIYRAQKGGGEWTNLGSNGATSYYFISARTTTLGYFVACLGNGATVATGPRVGGNQTLPIIVALTIVLVVLGGVPLAVLRRRGGQAAETPEP